MYYRNKIDVGLPVYTLSHLSKGQMEVNIFVAPFVYKLFTFYLIHLLFTWNVFKIQVLRTFDNLISSSVTHNMEMAGVQVHKKTQVDDL